MREKKKYYHNVLSTNPSMAGQVFTNYTKNVAHESVSGRTSLSESGRGAGQVNTKKICKEREKMRGKKTRMGEDEQFGLIDHFSRYADVIVDRQSVFF